MRRLALLLTLVAAHVLSGCTVTLPLTVATAGRRATRNPPHASPATLRPGDPVHILTRTAQDVSGRWAGVDSTVVPALYLLSVPSNERMAVPSDLVGRMTHVVKPPSLFPALFAGLVIDGLILWRVSQICVMFCSVNDGT